MESKYRWEYFVSSIISIVGTVFLSTVLFYFSFKEGKLDYQNILFWLGLFLLLSLVYIFYKFPLFGLVKLSLNEDEIVVINHFSKKVKLIKYSDIVSGKKEIRRTSTEAGDTDGYETIVFTSKDNFKFILDQNLYSNYYDLLKFILEKRN